MFTAIVWEIYEISPIALNVFILYVLCMILTRFTGKHFTYEAPYWLLTISANSGGTIALSTEDQSFIRLVQERVEAAIQEKDRQVYQADFSTQTIVNVGHTDMRNFNVNNESGQVVAGDMNSSTAVNSG